jgi:hypothetical protein
LLGGDGGVFAFGAHFAGSAASNPQDCPSNTVDRDFPNGTCVSMAATPDEKGYWILDGDRGHVYAFGTAGKYGEPATAYAGVPREFVPRFVAIVPTPDGLGYWVMTSGLSGLAKVLPFGDARYWGDTVALGAAHNGMPVGMASTGDDKGYWIADSDGGVFTFGDAHYYGSAATLHLAAPIVGIASTVTGKGYFLVAADGGVFAFGDAHFAGSAATLHLAAPIVGIASSTIPAGYWLVGADGGVFTFGHAQFYGSAAGSHLDRPIVAIASNLIPPA